MLEHICRHFAPVTLIVAGVNVDLCVTDSIDLCMYAVHGVYIGYYVTHEFTIP